MQFHKYVAIIVVFYHSDVGSQLQRKRSIMLFPLIFQFCKYTYIVHAFPTRKIFLVYAMFNLFPVCLKLMEILSDIYTGKVTVSRLITGCYKVIILMKHFKSDAGVFDGFVNYFLVYFTCISM